MINFTDSDGHIQTRGPGGHYTVHGGTTPQQHSHAAPQATGLYTCRICPLEGFL